MALGYPVLTFPGKSPRAAIAIGELCIEGRGCLKLENTHIIHFLFSNIIEWLFFEAVNVKKNFNDQQYSENNNWKFFWVDIEMINIIQIICIFKSLPKFS